jgi:hypothetical protein
VVQGDEPVSNQEKLKCYFNVQKDSRNEGIDYEGETKIVSITEQSNDNLSIDGYIYDIGPKSCDALKEALKTSSIALIWGTAGVCEVSSFQNGQQSLVDGANAIASRLESYNDGKLTKNPLKSLIIGESSVEWTTRLLDSDNELNGDLVSFGIISYLNRDSTLFSGLIGMYPTNIIANGIICYFYFLHLINYF